MMQHYGRMRQVGATGSPYAFLSADIMDPRFDEPYEEVRYACRIESPASSRSSRRAIRGRQLAERTNLQFFTLLSNC